jgi:hypothetical protein
MGRSIRAGIVLALATLTACGLTAVGLSGAGGGEDSDASTSTSSSTSSGSAAVDSATNDAGPDAPATCVADLDRDPANCGSCGHDCQGGGCASGNCQPTVFVANEPGVVGVAVVGADIMWTRPGPGLVRAMAAAGGTPRTILSEDGGGPPSPHGIATDGVSLFLTDRSAGRVMKYETDGGAVWATGIFSTPSGIATDGTAVYFTIQNQDGVLSVPAVGGDAGPRMSGLNYPAGVALSTDRIFASSGSGIMAGPKDGGSPVLIVSPASRFKDGGGDLIHSGIAIEGNTVFFTIDTLGIVATVPVLGGAGRVLARTQNGPFGIAASATTVYWANNGAGTIMKLAR